MKNITIALLLLLAAVGCQNKTEISYEDFVRSVNKINEGQKEVYEKSQEMTKLIREVQRKYPNEKITFDTSLGLSPDQEKKLLELVQKEQDVSSRGLLQKILDSEKEIDGLKKQVQEIQDKLPTPHVVKKGETHRDIALSYLETVHKIDKEKAKELVDRVALVDEMEVGYYTWLYYNDGVFGTFVTQGESKVNPNKLRYSMRKRQLEKAREEGRQEGMQQAAPAPTATDSIK
ncbi:MAG: hypothetical protein HY22_10505 [[Candidatus Thermochlorobacteriaceae] bacterium GBChlB]|nr:MAG: hypothetical protein HY22_10505 [[Candidatus Thermochlorobacteriaceae] bacterium GBChlB]